MPVQKLVKSAKPRELKPNDPTEPRPKRCPKCDSRAISEINPRTESGLDVWRCRVCREIGYGRRCISDPTSQGENGAIASDGTYRKNLLA